MNPFEPLAGARAPVTPGGVLLYDEPPRRTPGTMEPPAGSGLRMPALLARLLAARTLAERQQLLRDALAAMGFDALGYTRMRWIDQQALPLAACTAHSDRAWAEHYFREGYQAVDPRLHAIATSSLPCIWDIDDLEWRAPASFPREKLRRFVADLRATGVRSGLMVAVCWPSADERGCVSLRSVQPGTAHYTDALVGDALTMAYCVHEFHRRDEIVLPEGTRAVALEPRGLPPTQAEILRGLALGLCDKQIAARLNLSEHNLDYHMRQLRKRFGVRNRVQLLQSAAHIARAPA